MEGEAGIPTDLRYNRIVQVKDQRVSEIVKEAVLHCEGQGQSSCLVLNSWNSQMAEDHSAVVDIRQAPAGSCLSGIDLPLITLLTVGRRDAVHSSQVPSLVVNM